MSATKRASVTKAALDDAIAAIQSTNTYSAAARRLGISDPTFQKWREDDPELQRRCDEAKEKYWECSDVVKQALASELATDMLRNGIKQTTTVEKEAIVQLTGEIVTLVETREIHKPAPLKLVERYLSDNLEEVSLLKALVLGGFLPEQALEDFENAVIKFKKDIAGIISPQEQASPVTTASQSDLIGAATAAITRIFTKDAAAVSAKVASRSEPD